jgi:hydroxymethylpyrimidine/phosphomethylpyrimidine kinase
VKGRVLIVAGSDSGGGAGIQADLKTVTALGGYAMTAITALTAQNTRGVFGVVPVDPAFIRRQMEVVLDDIGADCIKTGMLHDAAVIDAVVDVIEERGLSVPLVVDPVMVAKGGASLLDPRAMDTLKRRLMLHATIVTPNLPETEALTGLTIRDREEMRHAASMLLTLGPRAAIVKGGHLDGPEVADVVAADDGLYEITGPRIETRHTHGTGCTLASAIAAGLAQGMELRPAIERARRYLVEAIRGAPGLGHGHGPLDHAHTVREFS